MWTRSALKQKAKVSFKANYWKSVLMGLVMLTIVGGVAASSSASTSGSGAGAALMSFDGASAAMVAAVLGLFALIVIGVAIICWLIKIFFVNPIEVGVQKFFINNLNDKAEIKEMAWAFDHNYLQGVKTMFLRDIFTFLWSLLLIVPGIIKSYEYRMIPFLIAEHPEMTYKEAFAESKRMMKGQKWNAFVLDLSFIGWFLLGAITLNLVSVFYFEPYYMQTYAALYEALRDGGQEA